MATLTKEERFTKKQIAEAKILDNNGTYFINGSILPVYINEDGDTYLIEEYEKASRANTSLKICSRMAFLLRLIQSDTTEA